MMFILVTFLCLSLNGILADRRLEDRFMHPHLPYTLDRGPLYNFLQDNATFWNIRAQKTLGKLLEKTKNENIAKNVILFIGDGMSFPTLAAGRVYSGGEEKELSFDKFPFTGLSKTYCVDKQVPDSACTSTAYLTGVKGNYQTIGVTSAVTLDDCQAMNDTSFHTHSIAAWSQAVGKRTGFVTTARTTHASPAGVYAHTAERNWESDTDILEANEDPKICRDIAYQLVHFDTGKKLNVILGGGRGEFLPKESVDEEGDQGFRSDRRNLIQEWLDEKKDSRKNAKYVWNREQLLSVNGNTDHLLGMFDASHVPYNVDRDQRMDPSLEEMVEAAIKVLRKSDNGYFLFVEGGRIDTAHHEVKARKAIDELRELSKAVQRAVEMTNERDTLIVVTADHSHSMTYSGYPDRGRDVLGLTGLKDDENMEYLTLNYANGPGYRKAGDDGSRVDISRLNYKDKEFQYPGMFPLKAETHGGEDVGIFARGPWSHLFTGVIEENVIPHVMAYASCVGEGRTACDGSQNQRPFSNNYNEPSEGLPTRRTTSRPRRPQSQSESGEEDSFSSRPSSNRQSTRRTTSRPRRPQNQPGSDEEDNFNSRPSSSRPHRPNRPSQVFEDDTLNSRPTLNRPHDSVRPMHSSQGHGSMFGSEEFGSQSQGSHFSHSQTYHHSERPMMSHHNMNEDNDRETVWAK